MTRVVCAALILALLQSPGIAQTASSAPACGPWFTSMWINDRKEVETNKMYPPQTCIVWDGTGQHLCGPSGCTDGPTPASK